VVDEALFELALARIVAERQEVENVGVLERR